MSNSLHLFCKSTMLQQRHTRRQSSCPKRDRQTNEKSRRRLRLWIRKFQASNIHPPSSIQHAMQQTSVRRIIPPSCHPPTHHVYVLLIQLIHHRTQRQNGRRRRRTNEGVDGWMDGWIGERTNERTVECALARNCVARKRFAVVRSFVRSFGF